MIFIKIVITGCNYVENVLIYELCLNFYFICVLNKALKENSSEVVQPFLMGCGTKEPKITQLCLAAIQRLMSHEVVSEVM